MAHVDISPVLSAFVKARIDGFSSEAPEQLRWQSGCVAGYAALPLYIGWTETIGLRADGAIIRWSTEYDYSEMRSVEDPKWVLLALVAGSNRYSELRALLPVRGPGAVDCGCRNHPLFTSG